MGLSNDMSFKVSWKGVYQQLCSSYHHKNRVENSSPSEAI